MRIGLVVPHIFMHEGILPEVIFSPGQLALALADGLVGQGIEVILFSPGPVFTRARNITADLSGFETELTGRGYGYIELLKKHPLVFISLARQVQAELISKAYTMANRDELDLVHIYTNEEELALAFASLCAKPVVFTHHDPFTYLIKYKSSMPKYAHLPWVSLSYAQRKDMPADTNWAGNIYHGLNAAAFTPRLEGEGSYVAYLGRIIEPKGVHLAIAAVKQHNAQLAPGETPLQLRIAGKHYASSAKDTYWQERIAPHIDGQEITYAGFINIRAAKQAFLVDASALIVPSLFEEPFGMVMIEALACGTPIIGLDSGAIPEIVKPGVTGYVIEKDENEDRVIEALAGAIGERNKLDRRACRQDFEHRFTLDKMCEGHKNMYRRLLVAETI